MTNVELYLWKRKKCSHFKQRLKLLGVRCVLHFKATEYEINHSIIKYNKHGCEKGVYSTSYSNHLVFLYT